MVPRRELIAQVRILLFFSRLAVENVLACAFLSAARSPFLIRTIAEPFTSTNSLKKTSEVAREEKKVCTVKGKRRRWNLEWQVKRRKSRKLAFRETFLLWS